MSPELDLYGRYGSRGGGGFRAAFRPLSTTQFLATKDISLEGFRKSAKKALELHDAWKKDKANVRDLVAPKRGRTYLDARVTMPSARARLSRSSGCIHCHQVVEREVAHYWNRRRAVPDRILWSYPMPRRVGFSCDPDECATVKTVSPGGLAERAGLRAGDRILSVDGQPVISIADIQWALHRAPDRGSLRLEVSRGGRKNAMTLTLPAGWRRRGEFAWRYAYNELKWKVLGLDQLEALPDDRRRGLGVADGESALRIGRVIRGENRWYRTHCNLEAWKAGLRPGDVIVDIDGRGKLDESEFLAHVLQECRPGADITLTILRQRRRQKFTYPLNTLK